MKSKAPLALMEQAIMVLVFALAAVLCLQAFVWSDALSTQKEAQDQAVLRAESAAEVLKHCYGDMDLAAATLGGSWDGLTWTLTYDENWQTPQGQPAYTIIVRPEHSAQQLLGRAQVEAITADGVSLFSLPVCWQEVDPYG